MGCRVEGQVPYRAHSTADQRAQGHLCDPPHNAPDHSRSDDATFVEGTCVKIRRSNNSVARMSTSMPAGERPGGVCRTIGHRILLSVAPGKKRLRLAAGERRLAFSNDLEISIMVPRNTAVTKQVGPDFLVQCLIVLAIGCGFGPYRDLPRSAPGLRGRGNKRRWDDLRQ